MDEGVDNLAFIFASFISVLSSVIEYLLLFLGDTSNKSSSWKLGVSCTAEVAHDCESVALKSSEVRFLLFDGHDGISPNCEVSRSILIWTDSLVLCALGCSSHAAVDGADGMNEEGAIEVFEGDKGYV